MKIIDEQLISSVVEQAKQSPRLRMNFNFHESLQDKCHRFLNALEPGTFIPVHHHPDKDETFVILKGKVRVTTYKNDGKILASCVISQESGTYGVDIPKNVWHGLECLEPSVLLECKAGPFVEHEVDGILEIKKGKAIDPTSLNKQGHDEGTRYRTGVYYTNAEDLPIIEKVFAEEQKNYQQPLVVEKLPLQNFYSAEEYHQDYLDKNPAGYCHLPESLFEFARQAKAANQREQS